MGCYACGSSEEQDRVVPFGRRDLGGVRSAKRRPALSAIRRGFKRIFTGTIYFGEGAHAGNNQLWDYRRFHFLDRLRIWCSRTVDEDLGDVKPDCNIISLSDAFWQEIQSHPIPVDVRVVRELTNNPGCLDLYTWLCWKCFHAKRTEQIPLLGPCGLITQLGVSEYSRDRNFRKRMREWLRIVRLYWPGCPVQLTKDSTALTVAPGSTIGPIYAPTGISGVKVRSRPR
jgi:hypothetical protein